jgi:hypothetical protein
MKISEVLEPYLKICTIRIDKKKTKVDQVINGAIIPSTKASTRTSKNSVVHTSDAEINKYFKIDRVEDEEFVEITKKSES